MRAFAFFIVLCIFLFVSSFSPVAFARMSGMPGGFGTVREATGEDQDILLSVVDELRSAHSLSCDEFHAVQVSTQVVAGVNYLMKVKCGEDKYFHVKIAKPLPHTGRPNFVLAVNTDSSLNAESPLTPFE
jgi:hypothetical protein